MCLTRNLKKLGIAALLSVPAYYAHGQAVYGNIYGVVQDASGAVVPNATVTITDTAKGISVTAQTNASGEYTVTHLIPDPYNVRVEASGFETFETTGVTVRADEGDKIDAAMKIGSEAQKVEVRSDTVPQLKTDRADVSTTFGAKEIEDLPIPNRNFTALQLLLPGAQQLGWSHAADENPQGSLQIQVDGQAFGGVAYELDGTDNQDPLLGIIVINPNSDALSETKITTQNFDAEFGKAVASVVTAQTKSGSNSFHGTAFDYRESAANLARDPFTQPLTVPQALKNQFGGSLGGPVLKDKAFFFVDYQGVRQKVGYSNTQTVPSTHLISSCLGQTVAANGVAGCDFSEYAAPALSTPIVVYQKNGQPYPGNVIPAAQLSPQALSLFRLLQPYAPNKFQDSAYPGLRANYAASGTGLFNSDEWDARGDYQARENLHTFARFSRFTDTLTGGVMFGAAGGAGFGLGGYGGNSTGANDSLAAGFDLAISPKLVTDVRVGYYRYNILDTKYDQNTSFANQLGIPGMNTGTLFTNGAPSFQLAEVGVFSSQPTVSDPQSAGPQYGAGLNVDRCNCPLTQREDQYQIANNWTKTVGNHEVKFGADLRYARNLRVPSDNDRTGVLQFGTGPTSNGSTGGLGFATLALGQVTNFNRFVSTSTNAKEFQKRTFFYAQDTWRPTPKWTLNYGLRYELYFPEAINSRAQGAVMNLATGYLQVAGVGSLGSNMGFNPPKYPLAPRLGLAYQASDKTVIRAGYGRSFDIGVFGSIFGHVATQNLPILANQQITTTTGVQGYAFDLATGPAAATPTAIPANGLLPSPGYAVNSKARPIDMRLPTLDAWNLSVQQSLTPTLSLTIAYVGNKGSHTLSALDGNNTNPNEPGIAIPASESSTGAALHYDPSATPGPGGTKNTTLLRRYYAGALPACSDPAYATPAGVTRGQCGWSNDVSYYGDNQDTHFNSLQVTIAKQLTRGISANVNYAWQRGFNYGSSYATWNRRLTYGRDDSIREQQVTAYGLIELPFGHGKPLFGNVGGVVNELIGGWQFSPVINYASGLPFTLGYSNCSEDIPGDAPCYINGPVRSLKMGPHGFAGGTGANALTFFAAQSITDVTQGTRGTSQFSTAGLDNIGNSGRNSVFGPHFFNGDLSLYKNFPIKESIAAQFRLDAFNGFNHINLGTPSGNQTSYTTPVNIDQTGSITNGPYPGGTTNPRQLQLGARLIF